MLGSRLLIPGAALAAGMPRWKFVANRFLTTIQNRIMGTHLSEAHTGYRAYSRELLLTVPFLRNSLDFSFDSELLYQAAEFGFRIEEVPARCRYFEEASSVGFKTGVVYGLKTLWAGVRLLLHRAGISPVAQVPGLTALCYGSSSTTRSSSLPRAIVRSRKRSPICCSAHCCRSAIPLGTRDDFPIGSSIGSRSGSRDELRSAPGSRTRRPASSSRAGADRPSRRARRDARPERGCPPRDRRAAARWTGRSGSGSQP